MFIERSSRKIRVARAAFVLVALAPCLLLCGWAMQRVSAWHRDSIRRSWQQVVGLPLEMQSVSHPRPGVTRAEGVTVRSPTGRPAFDVPVLELESAATEDRMRLEGVRIDAAAAAVLGRLAAEWLRGDARHPRNCIVEVAAVEWDGFRAEPGPLRIEGVGQDGARALRIVRADGDEVRVVRTVEPDAGETIERFEVDAHVTSPLPAALVAAAAGWSDAAAPALVGAGVRGDVHATFDGGGASGAAEGRLEGIDLAACCKAVKAAGGGIATVVVRRMAWRDGRLADAAIECRAGPGWIEAPLFDRLVLALGCRPGPAAQGGAERRNYDDAACTVELEGGQLVVRSGDAGGALASLGIQVLLHPPTSPIGFERLAWVVSPPAATFVPAGGPGAWLMSIVPDPSGGGKTATKPAPDGGRRGF